MNLLKIILINLGEHRLRAGWRILIVLAMRHPYWGEFYFDGEGRLFCFDKSNKYYTAMWIEDYQHRIEPSSWIELRNM